jgi:hypothetical protein
VWISVNIFKPTCIAHPAHKCEPLQINIIADHHIYVLDFMAQPLTSLSLPGTQGNVLHLPLFSFCTLT